MSETELLELFERRVQATIDRKNIYRFVDIIYDPNEEPAMPVIKPTVGRVVHYYKSLFDYENGTVRAAIVAAVLPSHDNVPEMISVGGFDPDGTMFNETCVPLLQEGDERPTKQAQGSWCEWMPYQHGQAAKTEQLEKQLKGS